MKNIEITQTGSCCASPIGKEESGTDQQTLNHLPVAIIGAGPIGLAAAAHLVERGEKFILLEAGEHVGHNISEWGHVRLFSPWQFNVDKAIERLLLSQGWVAPEPDELPTGYELLERYLLPFSQLPYIQSRLILNTKVVAVSRKDTDKMKSANRESIPFEIYAKVNGTLQVYEAKAVIDASGTWGHSNPLYASGVWTQEEQLLSNNIFYGIPDIKGKAGAKYIGKRIAVVGGGHSALNTLLELAELKESYPETEIVWLMRKNKVQDAYGGEENDQLAARGELGTRIHHLVDSKQIKVMTPFKIQQVKSKETKITISGMLNQTALDITEMDEIIVNAGSRPDFSFLRELRLNIDQATESVDTLAPLIDPNVHSCGTVRPHGEKELRHAEKGFYIVGMKSYGRAPTFLMATGYEQVRSIVAYLAGDYESALKVELDLPETGVCSINNSPLKSPESCCTTEIS
ncbi:NAD(P)-binding domain-containing protein [Paenibacillus radicis (ex Xue et al. 2023)]|uniref:NAD(P)-binding domain-containing protein n=1 Tax=Paenibacillus radicis (ex Xue et al. 2023) TaxID=2972489 RepID=A0ABT1YB68_9BACL|nr:NAD(P)-binding domain-containing protein [Paenibacillus radicis (ex Xue et al. 2023)]MCR8630147.1 NAD(P)-binding domain-containing protein [Paenibacillus radicis (ex Xue et al. 2023)]